VSSHNGVGTEVVQQITYTNGWRCSYNVLGVFLSSRIIGVKVFTVGEVSGRVGQDEWVDIYSCWRDVDEETGGLGGVEGVDLL
jgi:hypothetical protein